MESERASRPLNAHFLNERNRNTMSQPNEIILPVDVANDGNTVNQTYVHHRTEGNRSTYRGESSTLQSRDLIQIYATQARPGKGTLGASRQYVKTTRDVSVPNAAGDGNVVMPAIVNVEFSLPTGVTGEFVTELRQVAVAMLNNDAIMEDLNMQNEI